MSRYRSSCRSGQCGSCGVELRLFFTPAEVDEQRRGQGGAAAQHGRRSLFRFMEAAAAARQGATTMAPRARSPAEASASPAGGRSGQRTQSGAAGMAGAGRARREAAAQEGPGPRRLPRSLPPPPPRDPRRSSSYSASCRCPRPQPAPGCPQPSGAAEATVPPPAAGAVRGNRACPLRPRPLLSRRPSTAGRGSRGPRRAVPWSFVHKKGPR